LKRLWAKSQRRMIKMSKKYQSLDITAIIIASLILIVFIVLWVIFTGQFKDKFNPSEDVCDSYGKTSWDGSKIYIYGELNNPICQKWHSKNKCELNPEAEGCVCDEYEEIPIEKVIIDHYLADNNSYEYTQNIVGNIIVTPENKNTKVRTEKIDNYTLMVFQVLPNCLKSHLPNECEKGNTNYVFDNSTCRIKNIFDYNCSELTKSLFLTFVAKKSIS